MRTSQTFRGKVQDARLLLTDPRAWDAMLATLEGSEIICTLAKRRANRSLPQNAYFHGVVLPMLAEAAGYDDDSMKDALKWKFLRVEGANQNDLPTVRGTSELSTVEFNDFIEKCVRLGAEMFGLYIPDPGEHYV